jgi:ribonucleoside-diphosphate reductase alpha chain
MLLDIDEEIQREFKTAFDINYDILIEAAAERQKWIDMGQSLNLYNKFESLKYLNDLYFKAWESGLKSTYYLRGKSATRIEKSTIESSAEDAALVEEVKTEEDIILDGDLSQVKACSITDPDCESCQ